MRASLFCPIFLLYHCFYQAPSSVCGFQLARITTRWVSPLERHYSHTCYDRRGLCHLSATANVKDDGFYDDNLITMASEKLDWEKSDERNQKPVLNLSLRDTSPEERRINKDDDDDVLQWNRGQRWTITVDHLSDLGVFANDEGSTNKSSRALLKNCPQLFRLDPSAIRETAQWTIREFGIVYLQAAVLRDGNSILLSFRKDDASYGLEFMSVMMMTDAKTACAASSAFLLEAIRGGIQERAVSAALGAAGSATSKASQSIASDTMESFRKLRDANRHKK